MDYRWPKVIFPVVALGLLPACGGSSSPASTPTPAPTSAPTAVPASLPTPSPVPAPTPRNRPPEGEFRFTPEPKSDRIDIRPKVWMHVNATDFRDPDGDPLFLTVDWGDGGGNHIKCGLCRLEYKYRRQGIYTLRAEVTDLDHIVAKELTVYVQ